MHTRFPHRLLGHLTGLALLALLCFTIGHSFGAPSDEISRAVIAAGASSVEAATPGQFIRAYSSVLTRVQEKKFPQYVTSGIKLRPDLAPQITAATLRAHRIANVDDSCTWVDPIIRAAIAAAPHAKDAIIRAALETEPYARECVFAAAGETGTELAFHHHPGVDAGNINSTALGTINPGNFSNQGNVVTPTRP